jgi:hypothetical protein
VSEAENTKATRTPSRYRKVEVRTWGDEKFRSLSALPPCGQGLWLFLITGPHTGPIPGLFRAGRAAMAEELDWDLEAFDKAFQEVFQQGMVKADFKARVMWVPNAIKHNRPESPNVVKSWAAEFDLIPECDLKREALEHLRASVHALGEAFGKAFNETFGKPSGKPLAKAMPNQEQEQEQELNNEPNGSVGSADGKGAEKLSSDEKQSAGDSAEGKGEADGAKGLPRCNFDAVVGLYHEILPELPRVRIPTDKRRKDVRKVWNWVLTSKKSDGMPRATTGDEAMTWLRGYFDRARENDFLMGRGYRSAEHAGWKCDFDFLLTERGMKHVIEKTQGAAA